MSGSELRAGEVSCRRHGAVDDIDVEEMPLTASGNLDRRNYGGRGGTERRGEYEGPRIR